MDKLTEKQKKEAIALMNANDGINFSILAIHLSKMFNIELTENDVRKLYMESLFDEKLR